ncbi:DUF5819 family protein [Streptomyces lonarensis]|uniref:Uncharacterized protein n=1 Tax=Streptomyces lonarensis TaxID=700599 RepID=A0A7X6D4H8_9ACTN|nr:DUF5819 family protein [Streptomyces lonarensis]NJQ08027.1 hypothetical protein [Streptomyces lonarensis]
MEPPEKPEEPTGEDGPATGASGEAAGPAFPAPREAAEAAAQADHDEGGAAGESPPRDAVPAEQARGGAPTEGRPTAGGAERAPNPAPLTTEGFVFARLGWPARIVIALSVGLATVLGLWHIAMGFLYVAPANTLSKEYASVIRDGYSNPEFEQNWKLFAPNPLQSDIAVEVRAEFEAENGGVRTTDWINLTAMDIDAIRYNLLPSHTAHNTLRRAWDTYSNTLDEDGRPVGARGERATVYVHRIALLRLSTIMDTEPVQRLQIRSAVTPLATPPWDDRSVNTETVHDEQDWRTVLPPDRPRGALAPDGERPPPQPAPEADAEDAGGDEAAESEDTADGARRAPTTGSDQGTSGTEAREGES